MLVFARRALLLSFVAALSACSGLGTTPSASSARTDPATVAGGHLVWRPLSIHPNAGSPAILINFVANGPAQNGVPCIACVNGAQSNDNIGMTGPSSYVPTGAEWQYALSFTDISYTGKCKLAWTIVSSGKKTLDSFTASFNLTSAGGFALYALDRGRPKYSGAATLTGKVTCGTSSPSLKVPLEFQ
jgi:hypothetical protein